MRQKVPVELRAELNFGPGVPQIKDSSGASQGTHALRAFGPRADLSACGKVSHVALVRCNSFDEARVSAVVLQGPPHPPPHLQ